MGSLKSSSFSLGIDIREALENRAFIDAQVMANLRMEALMDEGKIPRWSYTGASIENLNVIDSLEELLNLDNHFKDDRLEDYKLSLALFECLGVDFEVSFLSNFCDVNSELLENYPTYSRSKKFKNPLWQNILLQPQSEHFRLINISLSRDARTVLSFCKLFTRKVDIELSEIQSRTFLNSERLGAAIQELLEFKIFCVSKEIKTYSCDLKLKKQSAFHRAWAKIIGHYHTSQMMTNGRLQKLKQDVLTSPNSLVKIIGSPKACILCGSKNTVRLGELVEIPPFHLGCSCTIAVTTPRIG